MFKNYEMLQSNLCSIDWATYPNNEYWSARSVRLCAGGGLLQLTVLCGRQEDSRGNHVLTVVRRATKNEYWGYEGMEQRA